jgi:hypothetical protein
MKRWLIVTAYQVQGGVRSAPILSLPRFTGRPGKAIHQELRMDTPFWGVGVGVGGGGGRVTKHQFYVILVKIK